MDTSKGEDTREEAFDGNDTTTVHRRVQARRRRPGHEARLYRHRCRPELRDQAIITLALEGRAAAGSGLPSSFVQHGCTEGRRPPMRLRGAQSSV